MSRYVLKPLKWMVETCIHLCRRDVLRLGGGRLNVSPRGSHSTPQVMLFSAQVQAQLCTAVRPPMLLFLEPDLSGDRTLHGDVGSCGPGLHRRHWKHCEAESMRTKPRRDLGSFVPFQR